MSRQEHPHACSLVVTIRLQHLCDEARPMALRALLGGGSEALKPCNEIYLEFLVDYGSTQFNALTTLI